MQCLQVSVLSGTPSMHSHTLGEKAGIRLTASSPVTPQRHRLTRAAFVNLLSLAVAVTAAVAGFAVVPFVHAVTADEPLFAASAAGAPATAELSLDWVERVAAKVLAQRRDAADQ